MIDCPLYYLGSPRFLKTTFHIITIIAIPVHTFGFYCILKKTPKHMSSVKLLLLNLHCWCVLLDITISLFGIPYVFFPIPAGYALGFGDAPSLIFYLAVTFLTGVSTSIFVIFENRYFILFGQNSVWRHVRKYCIAASYCILPLYFLPPQFAIPDQKEAEKYVWRTLTCNPEIPEEHDDMFILATDISILAVVIIIAEGVPTVQVGSFFCLNCYFLIFGKKPEGVSRRTIQMQYKLVISLIVQSTVTIIFFLVPVNAIILSVYTGYQNQIYNNFIFLAFSFHGIASTLIMVLAHKPYRDSLLSPFIKTQNPATIVMTNSDFRPRL